MPASGPDQMLRQRGLTAERTVTRAGQHSALDGRAAIRERPPVCRDLQQLWRVWSIAIMCPVYVCGRADRWPRWNAPIGSQTSYRS
jgi:hypothetical protein